MVMTFFYQPTRYFMRSFFFFFNDTATTEIYTLSLHDALPILADEKAFKVLVNDAARERAAAVISAESAGALIGEKFDKDRKSTRLNSSHLVISYAVFCLKKKNHISRLRSPLPPCDAPHQRSLH